MGGTLGGIFIILFVVSFLFFRRRRRAKQEGVDPAKDLGEKIVTSPKAENTTLQEMDQASGRPYELVANPLCEAGEWQISELETRRMNDGYRGPVELGGN